MTVLVVALLQMAVLVTITTGGDSVYHVLCDYDYKDRDVSPLVFDELLDKNQKDRSLTKEEFENACNGRELDWDQLLKIADQNFNGVISEEEFHVIGNMSSDIVALDKNRDRYITKEELGDDDAWDSIPEIFTQNSNSTSLHYYSKYLVILTAGDPVYHVLCERPNNDKYVVWPPTPTPLLLDEVLDKNPKDGFLTKEEFENACHDEVIPYYSNDAILDWNQLVKIADKNCDGAISKEEFHVIENMSSDIVALDKNRDFEISKEELGNNETWDSIKDRYKRCPSRHQDCWSNDDHLRISVYDYSDLMVKKMSESAVHCACQPAPHLEKLFDLNDGRTKSNDALDKIVLYRVKVDGKTQYFKGRTDDGPKIPMIVD